MKREFLGVGLVFFLLLVLIVPVSAHLQGYSVEPAYGTGGIPAPDITQITFWDLSLREMAIVITLAFLPVMVFPVELVFALKLFACLGFRRIARNNILGNTTRQAIYQCIARMPGIGLQDLIRETLVSRGALSYHLALLKIQNKIVVQKSHGNIGYFENNGRYDGLEQKVISYLRHDTGRKILGTLATYPGRSRSDLENLLAVSGPTITWHMKRLGDDGLLTMVKDGRYSRYSLTDMAAGYVRKHLVTGSREAPAFFPGSIRKGDLPSSDPCLSG